LRKGNEKEQQLVMAAKIID